MQRMRRIFEYWPYLFVAISIVGFVYMAVSR